MSDHYEVYEEPEPGLGPYALKVNGGSAIFNGPWATCVKEIFSMSRDPKDRLTVGCASIGNNVLVTDYKKYWNSFDSRR